MQSINDGFQSLRLLLPRTGQVDRLSKVSLTLGTLILGLIGLIKVQNTGRGSKSPTLWVFIGFIYFIVVFWMDTAGCCEINSDRQND